MKHKLFSTPDADSKDVSNTNSNTASSIVISGDNIDLTDSLKSYTTKKLTTALSRSTSPTVSEFHLSVSRNPSSTSLHSAEVTVRLPCGATIRAKDSCADMYASIDAVSDRVRSKARKFMSRRSKGYHRSKAIRTADFQEEDSQEEGDGTREGPGEGGRDDEDYVDAYLPTVTRVKSFDLPPVSVAEAVFALDYIDHDFYVFRDEDTGEVAVVYKRNGGGVGLIQPK
ncbi:hypothetical protein TrRE_jg9548 [Triparma retinervis]|uniref:Sigma 54 modulation/S30EA ribosomal protein C-terminal domain-containing protein n=1 Tax=Triparma retinervis TaxID=2557542 RepID=A0A9W7AAG1_9STRA|nr:hypothetical protein TrRE_jg9548 [Triparma retinervis]